MKWKTYQLAGPGQSDNLPKCAGVYAVYFDSRLVYIGQSCNVANRFSEHRIRYGYGRNIITPWGSFSDTTRVTVKVKPSRRLGDWAMWEIRLISRLQPEFNTQHRRKRAA